MEQQSVLGTRKILPLVISMSVPMAISMLVNSLYNIVDAYYVARISEDAMTAVSLVFPLQYLASAIAIGHGIGVNAASAYYSGAGDPERANGAASLGLLLSLVHTVVLTIAIPLLARPFLSAFTDNEVIIAYGTEYLSIVMYCTILTQLNLFYEKLFQSFGNMKVPVTCVITGCVTNIILDPIMIFGIGPFPEMGIAGAAWATNIGLGLQLVLYLVFVFKGELPIHPDARKGLRYKSLAGRIYTVAIPAAMSLSLQSAMVALLNVVLAGISAGGVLIMGIYYKLQGFIYLTTSGIVQGIRPIVAFNYGANSKKRVAEIYRTAFVLALIVMCVGTVLCLAIPEQLIGLFTSSEESVALGAAALRIICIGFPISALSVTSAGTLEGLGNGIWSFVISFTRYVLLLVPLAFVFSRFMGTQGVWTAFPVTEFVAAALAFVLYRRVYKQAFARLENPS